MGLTAESIVLITGAAMGMGRLHAQRAAAAGATVVLWDVNGPLVEALAAELGQKAHAYSVDVADSAAIQRAAKRVRKDVGDPSILINNAGIVRGKLFAEHSHEDIDLTMEVNALAPMHVTREFLPAMVAGATPANIVNVASAAGLLSNPRMSVYAASKWAVVGWSDSLRLELEMSGSKHVKVTTVCPSFISTGMFDGAKPPRLTRVMKPEAVVDRVWRAIERGTPMLMLPRMVGASKVLRGILPTRAWDVIGGRLFGVYSSMSEFRGRG